MLPDIECVSPRMDARNVLEENRRARSESSHILQFRRLRAQGLNYIARLYISWPWPWRANRGIFLRGKTNRTATSTRDDNLLLL
jgi:hypothetical protein